MSTGAFQRARELFDRAIELDAGQRTSFVRSAAGASPDLRDEVLALLARHSADTCPALDPHAVALAVAGLERDPLLGSRIGALTIEHVLAAGGMGVVYRATDTELGRPVAVKVLRNALPTTGALRRFDAESRILARLQHPGIARIYSTGVQELASGRVPYIVMELVDAARTVTDFARDRNLQLRERLELFADVCDAVHHGHQKGIVHRDLKPANILVGADGQSKVIDFGIARIIDASDNPSASGGGGPAKGETLTVPGQVIGTLAYMSPEQCGATDAAGAPLDADIRTDVYSLGVVLYELLSGRLPLAWVGAGGREFGPLEAMEAVRTRPPVMLGGLGPGLSGDLETITHKCLSKDRRLRYGSASELAADIRAFLRHEPIAARAPSAAYQLRMFVRRHRLLVGFSSGTLVLLLVTVVAVALAWFRASAARERAEREADNARRVTEFFRNTLMSGAPNRPGPDTAADSTDPMDPAPRHWPHAAGDPGALASLREVALLAASRLDREFPDDPLLRAGVAVDLSQLLFSLNEARAAAPLAVEAFNIRRRELGPNHPDTIFAAVGVAGVGPAGERLSAAEVAYHGALATYGRQDMRTAGIGVTLARELVGAGRGDEGRALAREAFRAVRDAPSSDPRAIARVSLLFAQWLDTTDGDQEERGRLVDSVVDLVRRGVDLGHDHSVACNMAAQARVGEFATLAQARQLQDEALNAAIAGGSSQMWLSEMYSQRALALLRMGRSADAEAQFRALAQRLDSAGLRDTDLALKSRGRLAAVLVNQHKNLDEASRLALDAVETMNRVIGDAFVDRRCYFRMVAAAADARLGHPERGLAAIAAEMQVVNAADPSKAIFWLHCYAHTQLAECQIDLRRFDEAQRNLALAQQYAEGIPESTFWIASDVHRTWIRLFEATGDAGEAERHRRLLPEVLIAQPEHPPN